jgi:hypothetical protein
VLDKFREPFLIRGKIQPQDVLTVLGGGPHQAVVDKDHPQFARVCLLSDFSYPLINHVASRMTGPEPELLYFYILLFPAKNQAEFRW